MATNKRRGPAPKPDRVIGYIRVSTFDQANEGVSLDAQRARLEAWCVMQGAELVRVEVDAGASAKTLERPALGRALAALHAGEAGALLVAKLDRLTRSVRDLDTLLTQHFGDGRADLVSVAESIDTRSASGRLVLNMLASVAQWEREAIGERTSAALTHLRDCGVHVGRSGIGWTRNADLDTDGRRVIVEVDDEVAVVARIRKLRRRGATFDAIAQTLNAEGVATKRAGRRWWATTVRNVVVRASVTPTKRAA
jgi:DNA invertase Pin-like site-specific DNA recombinase